VVTHEQLQAESNARAGQGLLRNAGAVRAGKFDNEGNVRRAFEALLEKCARSYEWMVVLSFRFPAQAGIRLRWMRRCWTPSIFRAAIGRLKDEKDDLRAEMNKKFADG